jgi:hypothetical protein
MADPGIGVGTGGFFASLMNPDLAGRVAQHLTPNPNPLAQQGQGAQPGAVDSVGNPSGGAPPPGANLPPSASTAPDPVNASYIADLMKYQRVSAAADDLNRNIQGMAAGFGTAQQQASKRAALGSGGGVGGGLADLATMQGMQDKTITDNEHARFMANAATFAQTLSQSLGRPVSIQEAQEIQNNPDMMKQLSATVGANAQTTDVQKNIETAVRAWADAHKDASPQDIADYRTSITTQMLPSNLDPIEKNMRQDSMAWDNAHKDDPKAVKPDYLTNLTQYKAHQDVVGNAQKDLAQEKNQFDTTDSKFAGLEENIAWLKAHPDAASSAVLDANWRTEGDVAKSYPKLTGENSDVIEARKRINQMNSQFMGEAIHGLGRISYAEASKLGGALTNLTQRGGSPGDVSTELDRLQEQAIRSRANVQAAAGKTLDSAHAPYADPQYFDQNDPFYSHATVAKGAGQPGTAGSGAASSGAAPQVDLRTSKDPQADYNSVPVGSVYIAPDGKPRTKQRSQ